MARFGVLSALAMAAFILGAAPCSFASAPAALAAPAPQIMNEPGALLAGGALLLLVGLLGLVLLRAKRLKKDLRDSHQLYSYLADNSADLIWVVDAKLKATYVSPAVERFLGYSPAEFLGGDLAVICGPSFCDKLREVSCSTVSEFSGPAPRGGLCKAGDACFEGDFTRKDGSAVWTETLITQTLDARGDITGFACVTRNIGRRKQAELTLRTQENRFRRLIEEHVDALLALDADRTIRYANPAALELLHAQPKTLLGTIFAHSVAVDEVLEIEITDPSGENSESKTVELRVSATHWEDEPGLLVSLRNISARKRMEESLKRSEERYRTVADHTHACESWIGPDGKLLYLSPSCATLTGYPNDAFDEGLSFLERILHPDDLVFWKQYLDKKAPADSESLDFRIFRHDGRLRWVSLVSRAVQGQDGAPLGLRCSMRDITERKLMEQQLRHHALHDALTGVGNRTLCLDRVLQGLERAKRRDDYFYAVLFLGLDRFKVVNESLGHVFGDKVLVEVSRRLASCVRELDTVSRFGGDEFVVFLEELVSPREATHIVKRICEVIRSPFLIENRSIQLTASVGVVLSPADYNNPEDLLRNATIAMYRAKESGRDRFKVFNSKMLERAVRVMNLESELRSGIANNEFTLMFQPVLHLKTERLIGFEALVRWLHPERGLVGPGEFIPLAEETGLIVEIGRWVLERACATLATWIATIPGAQDIVMSVNISGKQFSQAGLIEQVRRTLDYSGLDARNLKLEITETAIMDNAALAIERLVRLKNLGLTLSIDDFGTGYSSMSYLQKFPLDNLKIDLSFVRMMEIAPENIEIVKAIIDLAHNLGLEVVAEGVENLVQKQLLTKLGCEYGQGYLFARPVDQAQAAELIRKSRNTWAAPGLSLSA